ncbi:hypothetical protein ACUN7V_02440 [Quadrisphaera oryzae]|uniref:hypothetical protein n=1 Tax=Quadrisphaera oryzae TaxID=2509661 RepID=UPI004043E7CD
MPSTTTARCDVCREPFDRLDGLPHPRRTCSEPCRRARDAAYMAAWRRGVSLGPIAPAVGAAAALQRLADSLSDDDVRALVERAASVALRA